MADTLQKFVCSDGFQVQGPDEKEVVADAQKHLSEQHNQTHTDEEVKGMLQKVS
jgi:predicted small metal-binding protein